MAKRYTLRALVGVLGLVAAAAAAAHHSYAMFDGTRTLKVAGTVAKLEWTNPHTFLWVYVPNPESASGFDLYAFENGSPNVLTRRGWSKTTFATGEPVTIEYWPLTDGRTGGQTLVVETTHINPLARYPGPQPRAQAIGANARVMERIFLKDADTLQLEVEVVAPDALTQPDRRTRVYRRLPKTMATEITFCSENDRSITPGSGEERFDFTPPADLPPPPPR